MNSSEPLGLKPVLKHLKQCGKSLVLTDLFFKLVAFILLTPLVSLLFRMFLSLSGREVLADTDMAAFLLHPLGWLAAIIVGGAVIAVFALELGALLIIALAEADDKSSPLISVFRFLASRSAGLFRLTARIVARVLLVAAPFIAVGGGLFLFLLTKHDINYYLTEKPPEFWTAVVLIGAVLAGLIFVLLRLITGWIFALPLYLFEEIAPSEALSVSQTRAEGQKKKIAKSIVVWFAANSILSIALSGLLLGLARFIIPGAESSLWQIVLTVGLILLLFSIVNLVTSLIAILSFAVLLALLYSRLARTDAFQLPETRERQERNLPSLTRSRLLAGLVIGLLVSALIGVTAIHTIDLEDNVDITAHRGASGKAPENTLAAVRQAIEDQADWVEIDVQESQDGVVLVAHDSDLKKVSGEDIKIWEGTAAELRSIDIGSYFDPKFKDERVPTLAEVLEECRDKVRLNIELKYYGHDQNLEQKVVDLVEQHNMQDSVVIMSLKAEGIQKIKKLRPGWTVGLLTAVAVGDLTRADADFLAVKTTLATRSFISSAHLRSKDVFVWTVNDRVMMSVMIGRGADNLITDHPALAKQVLAERAEMSPVERLLLEVSLFLGEVPEPTEDELRP